MDREKLNEAAEEAAKKYINASDAFCNEVFDGFIKGSSWLMQQPLADRLTDEEKEKINKWYECATDMYMRGAPIELCGWIDLMRDIFGKDLFNEK